MKFNENEMINFYTEAVEKLKNDSMSFPEKMKFVNFYIQLNAPCSLEDFSYEQIEMYCFLGWYLYNQTEDENINTTNQ